jgi:xanthine dehydrogenase accessory factor
VVVREALNALRDRQPRLISLIGEAGESRPVSEGVVAYAMTCHSGGTLEIYMEPFLPKPLLVLIGHGPVVETLASLAEAIDLAVTMVAPEMTEALARLPLTRDTSVVVGTHGDADEEALERALNGETGYVSLISSRKRAAAVVESLRRRGVPAARFDRLKAPAGLDIGAATPEEIAVSILAEIVQHRRGKKRERLEDEDFRLTSSVENRDPVCGMIVEAASARYRSEASGRAVYFCCPGCKEAFDREPHRYGANLLQ